MATSVPRVRPDGLTLPARTAVPTPARPSAAYMRGEASSFFFGWRPALRDPRDDVRAAWSNAAARAIDALHNSGWLAGGIDQAVAMTVGAGLRLNAAPDYDELGWTTETANDWARNVERRWVAWSEQPIECDLTGRMSVAQMSASSMRTWFGTGEIVAQLPAIRRAFATTRSKVQLIPPNRLVQATDGHAMVQGVRMDASGFPVAYRFRMSDRYGMDREVDVRARDSVGRPQVVHVFDGGPGQVRGITPLAPALLVVRQFDQLANATLTAALLQAIFAATIESGAPTSDVLNALRDEGEQGVGPGTIDGMLAAKADWYESTKIDLGSHGKVAHLFPGEKLNLNRSEHPNTTYEPFARFLLREIARCLGITFEQLTGDYTGATYSSVRMATSEVWQIVQYRRQNIISRFLQPVYEMWLEEEIDAGRIPFPGGVEGFFDNRAAACACNWRGSAKPQADDLKFAKSAETLMKIGVLPMEVICGELGLDWEDVQDALKREQDRRRKLGIPDPQFGSAPAKGDDDGEAANAG